MLLTQAALDDRRARLPLPDRLNRLKGVDQHDYAPSKIIANMQRAPQTERKRESYGQTGLMLEGRSGCPRSASNARPKDRRLAHSPCCRQWSCAAYHQKCRTVGGCYHAVYFHTRSLVGRERAAISWIWVRDDAPSASQQQIIDEAANES